MTKTPDPAVLLGLAEREMLNCATGALIKQAPGVPQSGYRRAAAEWATIAAALRAIAKGEG